ncbi:hypothetical protein JYU11_03100 [bacterium AH-315-G05]|nr:hypothetical protein [bacterium AH-315-L21]MBN4063103.1 hypothetical protein [Alkaliphilus sp. AH-315-G20]MBN4069875.1 hypothetical protein [bacterium AH-315-G05]
MAVVRTERKQTNVGTCDGLPSIKWGSPKISLVTCVLMVVCATGETT